jgi:hypothetical protein
VPREKHLDAPTAVAHPRAGDFAQRARKSFRG